MKKLLTQVTLSGFTPKADRSYTLRFNTSLEVSKEQASIIHELFQSNGTLYYKSDEGLSTDEINQIDKVVLDKPNGKSQSERLRNALYVLCKQKKGNDPTKEEFARYYDSKMEKFIQHVLGQLDKD